MDNTEFKRQNRAAAANTKELLSSGFLDTLGSDRFNPSKPVTFDAMEEVFLKYAALFVKGFAEELSKNDSNASGNLTDSLRFEFTKSGKIYNADIYMSDYAKFVDEGVQGVNASKNINTTSPYKFKFANPSTKHIEALEKWIKEKNVTALITAPKGIATEATKVKSLAAAMATSIKQRGLKATYFKKTVVERLINNFKTDVAKAAGEDMKINILF